MNASDPDVKRWTLDELSWYVFCRTLPRPKRFVHRGTNGEWIASQPIDPGDLVYLDPRATP